MFKFAVKKLIKNKWLSACLIIGCTLAVAVLSSVPIYRDAVMQRMLEKDLERIYSEKGVYPGVVKLRANVQSVGNQSDLTRTEAYDKYKTEFTEILSETMNVPLINSYERITFANLRAYRYPKDKKDNGAYVSLMGQNSLEEHINIIAGRMCSDKISEDGVIEVIANQMTLYNTKMVMGIDYMITPDITSGIELKIRIVGVYEAKSEDTDYWQRDESELNNAIIGSFSLLSGDFAKENETMLSGFTVSNNYNYKEMRVDNVEKMVKGLKEIEGKFLWLGSVSAPAREIMESYPERADKLFLTLTVLQIPLILILVLYIFMVSGLLIEHDTNEISVLKSRGAKSGQIVKVYLAESMVFGGASFILGIPLSFLICRFLGLSNGFLEFVNRKTIFLNFSFEIILFALVALIVFAITMLIPSAIASKTDIVDLKRSRSKIGKKAIWEKFYLDVLLVLLSLYGLYNYRSRQSVIISLGTSSDSVPIDPFLFIMSASFIVGAGMLFLRLYPYLMRGIFKIGRKHWSPTIYASFVNTSRSGGKDRFIMLFLIFSLSIGIFNATAARTLSKNEEEKIAYKTGADIVMSFEWRQTTDESGKTINVEAKTDPISSIEGIEKVTKVINETNSVVYGKKAKTTRGTTLMGINPDEFREIAWWREDILENNMDYYLQLLKNNSAAVLLSSSLKEKLSVELGNTINIQVLNGDRLTCVVAAFIDYWPTYYENIDGELEEKDMIVMNYNYLQNQSAPLYYSIWAKTNETVDTKTIYDGIEATGLKLISLSDRRQETIAAKGDALFQGINGTLTMGFVMTLVISAIGFIIFWILSVKKRSLQFGILRSMGLRQKGITAILSWDQFFVSGTSVLVGLAVGFITSKLYIPVLQISAAASDQIPQLLITSSSADYIRIVVSVLVMIIIGIMVLSGVTRRMYIGQTLKLGED